MLADQDAGACSQARMDAPLLNDNRFKLALFAFNLTGGQTISTAPGVNNPSWAQNVRLAQMADRAGLEALIPVGRWIGFGGPSQYHSKSFESYTWAAGLGALTEYSMVVATGHVPALHPIVAAKQSATVDHITNGRFALNLVSGWFKTEMEFFGANMLDHDGRYAQADEWISLVKRLWNETGDFDFSGKYFDVRGAAAEPKPLQRPHPVVINAGISERGQRFAATHADIGFIAGENVAQVAENARAFKRVAQAQGKQTIILADIVVCCFPTDDEAHAYAKLVGDKGDRIAAGNNMAIMSAHSKGWTDEQYARFERQFMQSYGCAQAVGSPETVAGICAELAEAGVDGAAFSIMGHWEENLRLITEQVVPLLEQAGLRRPHAERLGAR
jgi:FMNH2-dependent dimethyl sulfone monooxygenase